MQRHRRVQRSGLESSDSERQTIEECRDLEELGPGGAQRRRAGSCYAESLMAAVSGRRRLSTRKGVILCV